MPSWRPGHGRQPGGRHRVADLDRDYIGSGMYEQAYRRIEAAPCEEHPGRGRFRIPDFPGLYCHIPFLQSQGSEGARRGRLRSSDDVRGLLLVELTEVEQQRGVIAEGCAGLSWAGHTPLVPGAL